MFPLAGPPVPWREFPFPLYLYNPPGQNVEEFLSPGDDRPQSIAIVCPSGASGRRQTAWVRCPWSRRGARTKSRICRKAEEKPSSPEQLLNWFARRSAAFGRSLLCTDSARHRTNSGSALPPQEE